MVGNRVKVKVVKNKVAPPFRQAEFDIMFGKGISRSGSIIDIGVEMELISKRGAFFAYNETRIGQGRENAKQYLEEHVEMMDETREDHPRRQEGRRDPDRRRGGDRGVVGADRARAGGVPALLLGQHEGGHA